MVARTGHTRVSFQLPEVYIRVPSSVDIHTSLAGGFCVPTSHLSPFLHLFPPLNVSVSPAHFRIACFLHIAPRFLFWFPRDRVCIKGVDEATYIKNKSSTQASAQPCVYGDLAVVQVARHNSPTSPIIRLPLLIYARLCVTRAGLLFLHLFVFLDLGTLVIFPLSPLLLCFRPYLYVSPFLGLRFPNFLCRVFLVIHSEVGLFISFLADLPIFFPLTFLFFSPPFPLFTRVSISTRPIARTIASHHTRHFCAMTKLSPFHPPFPFPMCMVRFWFSGV